MCWDGVSWRDELDLPVNQTFSFRFVVDGQWRVSEDYPIKGLENVMVNQIHIDETFPVSKERKPKGKQPEKKKYYF
jgi:hypothetical protein